MKQSVWLAILLFAMPLLGQASAPAHEDPWKPLSFLEGTWGVKATGAGGAALSGRYSFGLELDGHVMARHGTTDPNCKGPADFDCKHGI